MSTKSVQDFNTIQFEKKLQSLKDSQESINSFCHWCLQNHQHHKKIVISWLNVLKRVSIEQRLTLFYLANDVIQYSKRRNLEFVESWSTTLQKATTLVRDEKIKHKILRIFKIWEQRCIYGEEFITDLSGLISATPTRRNDEPQEFQPTYLITKIRHCSKLEEDTDLKLKKFKEHNPKMINVESLCSSLKDRAQVDDVEKEMEDYVSHMEAYVNALKQEMKARHNLISLLQQAEQHLDKDKKDVKTVEKAYKAFALKVKDQKKHLEELIPRLASPVPSPDINAPSPSPDSDLDLPNPESPPKESFLTTLYQKAGFYNPVPPPAVTEGGSFINNGFSSFMGGNMPFNVSESMNSVFGKRETPPNSNPSGPQNNYANSLTSLFPSITQPPPPPDTPAPLPVSAPNQAFPYNASQVPLMPPPLPPFCNKNDSYNNSAGYREVYNENGSNDYGNNYTQNNRYQPESNFQSNTSSYSNTFNSGYNDEYNPEEEPETWESEGGVWEQPPVDMETPESPPMFEKESFSEPVEYHESHSGGSGSVDVDHRILALPGQNPGHRKKDIDHRNLISLTGSPKDGESNSWSGQGDQDYRKGQQTEDKADRDYRLPFTFDALKLPPPPPPPNSQQIQIMQQKSNHKRNQSPRKGVDNVESIDMDLSDEDPVNDNFKFVRLNENNKTLEPPPPFPEFSDEADANANDILDDLNNDLDEDNLIFGEEFDESGGQWDEQQHMMGGPPFPCGPGGHHGGILPPVPHMMFIPNNNNFVNGRGRGNNKRGRGDFRGARRNWGGGRKNRGRGPRRFFRGRFRGGGGGHFN
nr:uncharacterized protein LOC111422781 isoform X2 [Onthophagus taurus]